jgi:chromosome partitioning protein
MEIIAIANQKGGCGKTTTAINLAAELGRRDKRTLLIDMDPQGHASLGMGLANRELPGLYEVLSDDASLSETIVSDVVRNVDVIPANISVAAVEPLLADQPGRERQLLDQLVPLRDMYDYALIDCPPSLGMLSINALRSADQVLAPVDASLFALDGIRQLQGIVDLLNEKYDMHLSIRVIPAMFDTHTRFARNMLEQIHEHMPVGLSGVQIRHTVRVREAASSGVPLTLYAPQSTAAHDYRLLADELLQADRQAVATTLDDTTRTTFEIECEDADMSHPGAKPRRQMIVLTFADIECRRLQLAGDFNDWIPDRDIETRNVNGNWQKIFTAEPGVYEYRLLIDGKWQSDPTNPHEIPNEIGGVNSLLQVPVHL